MNFWLPVDYINKIIDLILAFFGFKKDAGAQIQQTINNQKKKSVLNIKIGGVHNYYQIGQEKVSLKESTDSTTNIMLQQPDDEEIEEAVNQYIQSQIETETNKENI